MNDSTTTHRRSARWAGAAGLVAAGAIAGGVLAGTLSARPPPRRPPAVAPRRPRASRRPGGRRPPSRCAPPTPTGTTVHLLQGAVARGLLTTDEGGERMAAAYAARNLDDLPPLTADLPPALAAVQAPTAPGWRPLAAQTWAQTRASVSGLTAGGWRSPRTVAFLGAFLVALLALIALGAAGLDLLVGGPHGHGGFAAHH